MPLGPFDQNIVKASWLRQQILANASMLWRGKQLELIFWRESGQTNFTTDQFNCALVDQGDGAIDADSSLAWGLDTHHLHNGFYTREEAMENLLGWTEKAMERLIVKPPGGWWRMRVPLPATA